VPATRGFRHSTFLERPWEKYKILSKINRFEAERLSIDTDSTWQASGIHDRPEVPPISLSGVSAARMNHLFDTAAFIRRGAAVRNF